MPELPEIEAFRHHIESTALNQKVNHVDVREDRVLGVSAQKLWSNVTGHAFETAVRHGKYVLIQLDNQKWLALHFGMTGDVDYYDDEQEEPEHSRVVFHFENESYLAFENMRMLGEVMVVDDREDFVAAKELGPDALHLDYDGFQARLSGRRGMIKTALMDQQVLAGIGNVYSDEILFQSHLHPRSQVPQLNDDHLHTIYGSMQSVLKTAIERRIRGDKLPDSFLIPHRAPREDCPQCDGQVEQISISGRNAYCCPNCQKEIA